MPPPKHEFDVFISYKSPDTSLIERITSDLRSHGLRLWLDQEIHPGQSFEEVIEAIHLSAAAAIFIGTGLGKWERLEMRSLVRQCVELDVPVTPVLLPGVDKPPPDLAILGEFKCVRFVQGINELQAMRELISCITGQGHVVPIPEMTRAAVTIRPPAAKLTYEEQLMRGMQVALAKARELGYDVENMDVTGSVAKGVCSVHVAPLPDPDFISVGGDLSVKVDANSEQILACQRGQ